MLSFPVMRSSQMHMFVLERNSSTNLVLLVCPALCAQSWLGDGDDGGGGSHWLKVLSEPDVILITLTGICFIL